MSHADVAVEGEPSIVDVDPAADPLTLDAEGESTREREPGVVASVTMLAVSHQVRMRRAKAELARGAGTNDGERLLHELVASEVGVALQLVDVEAGLASLLSKTVADPKLAIEVAKVFRETVALSAAVRRRMEGCLSAAATLRAQRILLNLRPPHGD